MVTSQGFFISVSKFVKFPFFKCLCFIWTFVFYDLFYKTMIVLCNLMYCVPGETNYQAHWRLLISIVYTKLLTLTSALSKFFTVYLTILRNFRKQ